MFQVTITELGAVQFKSEATRLIVSMDTLEDALAFLRYVAKHVAAFKKFIEITDEQFLFLQEMIALFQTAIENRGTGRRGI